MSSSLPNIVLIYPDQMRYDATSRSGNKLVKTPAFDALAEAGAYFENAYTSFPLCCPFRASLMSGAYAHSIGMCTNHYPINLNWPGTFLPQTVKTRGYETAWIGKWHLNGGSKFDYVPREYRLGFDEFIGYSRGHHYINGIFYRNDDRTPRTSRRFEPEYQTGHLLEFMGRMVRNDRPFMAMICYGIPHSPVDMSVEPYLNMYSPENVELPPTVPSWKAEASARYRAKYYGLVSCVDDQLARIDAWLRENGIFDNTAVIFVSDHGDMCGEHGLEYKSSFHEASAHVPLAIRWPSVIASGTRVSQIVDPAVDLFPTILEMCGAELPSFAQGTSLLRAACSGYEPEREDVGYYELLKVSEEACEVLDFQERKQYPERGIRTPDWLYVERCGVPAVLFDRKNDKYEQFNLVTDPYSLEQMEQLKSALKRKMAETNDSWDIQAKYPPEDYQNHADSNNWYEKLMSQAIFE